jgi:predicted alpha/beta-fold hydrolase
MTTPYVPSWWLPNRHAMTIAGNFLRRRARRAGWRERCELPDGDFVDLDRTDGGGPLLLICHGLEGSARSGYVVETIACARSRGFATCALNFRGCSGEPNRRPRFYHSGDTDDLAFIVDKLRAERPGRRLAVVGFSLGGNVVTKYLGERGAAAPVDAAAVISVPFDLAACANALDGPGIASFIYRERFLRMLRRKIILKARRLPSLTPLVDAARVARTFRAFDGAVTAPLHGFASADDYWARASSGPWLPAVQTPMLLIAATDDPFIPAGSLPLAAAQKNSALTVDVLASGGHVGFLSGPPWRVEPWAERRAIDFLAARV